MKSRRTNIGALTAAALAMSMPGLAHPGGIQTAPSVTQSDKIIRVRHERTKRKKPTRADRRAANRRRIRSFRNRRKARIKLIKAQQNPLIEGMTNWQNTRFWREFVASGAKRKDIQKLAEKWSKEERSAHAAL